MNNNDEPLSEARLMVLLGERAERIEVHPDLAGVALSAADPARPLTHTRLWWTAVAAVVFVVGGAALFARQSPRADDTGAAVQLAGDLVEFAAPAPREQLLVWMNPDATSAEVDAVAFTLADLAAVERYTYTDRAASYEEFMVYFADKPEVIELVSPETLPTYFRVDTATPAEIAETVDPLPGVEATETHHPSDE